MQWLLEQQQGRHLSWQSPPQRERDDDAPGHDPRYHLDSGSQLHQKQRREAGYGDAPDQERQPVVLPIRGAAPTG